MKKQQKKSYVQRSCWCKWWAISLYSCNKLQLFLLSCTLIQTTVAIINYIHLWNHMSCNKQKYQTVKLKLCIQLNHLRYVLIFHDMEVSHRWWGQGRLHITTLYKIYFKIKTNMMRVSNKLQKTVNKWLLFTATQKWQTWCFIFLTNKVSIFVHFSSL